MSNTKPRENKLGQRHLDPGGLYLKACTVRAYWRAACEHDNLPADAKSARFSAGNPFVPYHTRANEELRAAIEADRRSTR